MTDDPQPSPPLQEPFGRQRGLRGHPGPARAFVAVALISQIIWQTRLSLMAPFRIPDYLAAFSGFGGPAPAITRLLGKIWPFLWLGPLLSLLLTVDLLRRRVIPTSRAVAVLIIAVMLTFLMTVLFYEGMLGPALKAAAILR